MNNGNPNEITTYLTPGASTTSGSAFYKSPPCKEIIVNFNGYILGKRNLTITQLSSQYELSRSAILRSNSSLTSTNTLTLNSINKKNFPRDPFSKSDRHLTHRSSYVWLETTQGKMQRYLRYFYINMEHAWDMKVRQIVGIKNRRSQIIILWKDLHWI